MTPRILLLLALLLHALAPPCPALLTAPPPDRLVYCATNLQVEQNADRLISLLERTRACGATGIVLADSKFARLGDLPDQYFQNARRVRAAAEALGIEIIPAVFPVGYSNDLLWHDPNLAEALEVRDALFTVGPGGATLTPDPPVSLPGAEMDDLSRWTWHDETVRTDDGAALIADPAGSNARLVQRLTLAPHRQYHVSVRVRTQDFTGTPEIKALAPRPGADARSLIFSNLGVKRTQEWTTHHAVFNTLENTDVSLYFGCWDGGAGSLWFDDARIEEVGLLNLVRREGAPLAISLELPDGSRRALTEGADFDPVRDPGLGIDPWPGEYTVWHEPPTIRTSPDLPAGARLRVSSFHTVTIYDGQVMICPSEPRTLELLRDQAVRMHDLWNADAYFMSHDEIRCLNQDAACRRRNMTPGGILADNARACTRILREVAPHARIYVWSDMFDPNHNATDEYYLVNGDLAGSWEGLEKDVIVACWYFERRDQSIGFFSGRGHPILVAGYYDAPVERIDGWLRSARPAPGLRGLMYTTWAQRYDDLEAFARRAWGAPSGP